MSRFWDLRTGYPIGWGVDAALHTNAEFETSSLRGPAAFFPKTQEISVDFEIAFAFDDAMVFLGLLCPYHMQCESAEHLLLAITIHCENI